MTALQESARKSFEAWKKTGSCFYLSRNNAPGSDLDGYQDAYTQGQWVAWQAALEQHEADKPFQPDWTNYRQGVEDGKAEALAQQGEPVAGLNRSYTEQLINALHENSDPVSIDAAEEFQRLLAAALAQQATLVPQEWTNLLAYALQDDMHNRLTPRVVDIAYTAFTLAKRPNSEDGGASDWFNDTKPKVTELIAKLRKDLIEEFAAAPAPPAQQREPTDDQLVKGVKAMRLFVTKNSVADFKLGYIAALAAAPAPQPAKRPRTAVQSIALASNARMSNPRS